MPRVPEPWERAMMREYDIEDVAELRKVLTQPPSAKSGRSDEIRASQLEFERYAENYAREHKLDFLWRVPIAGKLALFFLLLSALALIFIVGATLFVAGVIRADWKGIIIGLAVTGLFGCFCKAWWRGCTGFWKLSTKRGSAPSTCSFRFSVFPTTWGIFFSLKANPNYFKAMDSGTVLAQRTRVLLWRKCPTTLRKIKSS